MAKLEIEIGAITSGLVKGLKDAEGKLNDFSNKAVAVGKTLSLAVTAPLTGFGALTLRTFGNFESALNRASAITGAVGQDFDNLTAKARELGATTQFSASQAAEAITFLGQAGFSTDKILGSLDDTLKLAAASGLDLGRSADIVSNVLTGFQLETEQLGNTVDILSKAFTTSNQDLDQLSEALKFAGPVASSFGVSIEESVAAIGALSDAGLQGSVAGTGFRRVLSVLGSEAGKLGITTTDSAGKLRPLVDILEDLEKRGLTASEALEIFGDRGGPAISVLLARGSASIREYTESLEDAGGTADRLANVQTQGLNGALRSLGSAFEELQLRIGESGLASAAQKLVEGLTGLIRKISELDSTTISVITGVAAFAAAIGPALVAVGSLIKLIPIATAGLGALKIAFTALTGPIGLTVAALGALTLGISSYVNSVQLSEEATKKQAEAFKEFANASKLVSDAQGLVNQANTQYQQGLTQQVEQSKELIKLKIEEVKATLQQAKAVNALALEEAKRTTFLDNLETVFLPGLLTKQRRVNAVTQEAAERQAELQRQLNELTISYFNIGKKIDSTERSLSGLNETTKLTFEEFSKLTDLAKERVFAQWDAEAKEFNQTLNETISLTRRIEQAVKNISFDIVDIGLDLGDSLPVNEIADQFDEGLERIRLKVEDLNGAFIGLGSVIGQAFNSPALGVFVGQFVSFASKLIASNFKVASSSAVAAASQSAIATGPAAIFTLPAFIAGGLGLIASAFAAFGGSGVGGRSRGGSGVGSGIASNISGSGATAFGFDRNIELFGRVEVEGDKLVYAIANSQNYRN